MTMGLLDRWLGRRDAGADALYAAVVDRARAPHWYVEGAVPDTIDGRFDMVATILSLVLLRLERDSAAAAPSARLTEAFVTDMDGQLREIGVGDVIVGKHVGQMMGMLGGRLGAYRDALSGGDMRATLVRNVYRGVEPGDAALAHVAAQVAAFDAALAGRSTTAVLAGDLP